MTAFWAHDMTPYEKTITAPDESFVIELEESPAVGDVLWHPARDGRLLMRVQWVTLETGEFAFVQESPDTPSASVQLPASPEQGRRDSVVPFAAPRGDSSRSVKSDPSRAR